MKFYSKFIKKNTQGVIINIVFKTRSFFRVDRNEMVFLLYNLKELIAINNVKLANRINHVKVLFYFLLFDLFYIFTETSHRNNKMM